MDYRAGMTVKVKRVYDKVEPDDGLRVLIDRLWPRGVSKEDPRVGLWLKDVAPSDELRKQVHATGDWDAFAERYRQELDANDEAVQALRRVVREHDTVTLVYAWKETEHSNALALKTILGL